MARKDFDDYYYKIVSQYQELNRVFKDLSEEAQSGMVEPERLTQLQATIEPVKNSYHTLSYIKYLLDRPTRKSKQPRYNNQNKKIISQTKGYHKEDVVENNNKILNTLKRRG